MASKSPATSPRTTNNEPPTRTADRLMQHANKGADLEVDGKGLRIGIVQARFNEDITNALAEACLGELAALGVAKSDIDHVSVPGALEVPVALQAMAERNRYHALVALGCIIR